MPATIRRASRRCWPASKPDARNWWLQPGTAQRTESPEVKQLADRIVRGEAALKEATERAAKLAAAAQPAERQCDVFTSIATLHVIKKAKQ